MNRSPQFAEIRPSGHPSVDRLTFEENKRWILVSVLALGDMETRRDSHLEGTLDGSLAKIRDNHELIVDTTIFAMVLQHTVYV